MSSITEDELEELIKSIEENMVDKDEATCKMYTVHGYKGLEDNNIRIASDIGLDIDEEEDINIFYVALTRGMKNIIMDNIHIIGISLIQDTLTNYIIYNESVQQNKPISISLPSNGIQTKIFDFFK